MERVNLKMIPFTQNTEEYLDESPSEFMIFNKLKSYNVGKLIKMLAMVCACMFGIGSNFASHIIGPLKGILMKVRL